MFVGEVREDGNDGVENKTNENYRKVKFLFFLQWWDIGAVLEVGEEGQQEIEGEEKTDDYVDE